MRISTAMIYQRSVDSMMDRQSALSKTQQQLATGKRILTPSDDPIGAARVIDLNIGLESIKQYQTNLDYAESRMILVETVLTSALNELQRVRELALQANNGALGADQRMGIAGEVRQILDQLLSLANTQDINDEFIFGGYQGMITPFSDDGLGNFTYNGDQGKRLLQISDNRKIAVSEPGDMVFMDVPASGGGIQDIFTTIYGFITDLEANNTSATVLADIDSAVDNIIKTIADIGGRQNAISSQRELNESNKFQLQKSLSVLQDLDFAEAISLFSQQLLGLQASQQSFVKIQNLSLFNYL